MAHFGEPPTSRPWCFVASRVSKEFFSELHSDAIYVTKSLDFIVCCRGTAGSLARMLVANLWILFFFPFFVCAVILDVVTNGNSPLRALSYAFSGVFLTGCCMTNCAYPHGRSFWYSF